jgi:hypothetical protein
MVKAAQILGNLNENFFDFFDLAVKKFYGSRIDSTRRSPGVLRSKTPKANSEGVRPRKGLQRYPFDAAGGKRYKRKARFFAEQKMRPKFL